MYIIHICYSRPHLMVQLKNIYGNKKRDCTSHGSPGARMMSRRFRDCCTPDSWAKGGQSIYIYRTDNIYLYTYISGIPSGPLSGGPSEVIPGASSFWNYGELGRSGAHRLQCPYMSQGLADTNRSSRGKYKGPECKD